MAIARRVFIHRITMKSDGNFAYSSYGVNCSEVEVDILTGEVEVLRSDILFDCGQRLVTIHGEWLATLSIPWISPYSTYRHPV